MAATKRQMNTRAVSFTPTDGSPTTFTGVTNIAVATNGNLAKFSGDGDLFPTTVVHDYSDPSITVTTADFAAATANGVGTRGAFSAVIKDARNQTAGSLPGDITISMSTAIVQDIPLTAGYRQFGQSTVTFMSESPDGITSPISLSIA